MDKYKENEAHLPYFGAAPRIKYNDMIYLLTANG